MVEMRHVHVLNLGAGVQSTALALLGQEGRLLDPEGLPIKFDAARSNAFFCYGGNQPFG